jgi:hypothetical protein
MIFGYKNLEMLNVSKKHEQKLFLELQSTLLHRARNNCEGSNGRCEVLLEQLISSEMLRNQ